MSELKKVGYENYKETKYLEKYYDYCGWYYITQSRGKYYVKHQLAPNPTLYKKVGSYDTLRGARIGLSRYCDGMPSRCK